MPTISVDAPTKQWLEITRPGRCCRVVRQHDQHSLHGSGICHRLRRDHGWLVRLEDGVGKTRTVSSMTHIFETALQFAIVYAVLVAFWYVMRMGPDKLQG
jgi:hypothetical protein